VLFAAMALVGIGAFVSRSRHRPASPLSAMVRTAMVPVATLNQPASIAQRYHLFEIAFDGDILATNGADSHDKRHVHVYDAAHPELEPMELVKPSGISPSSTWPMALAVNHGVVVVGTVGWSPSSLDPASQHGAVAMFERREGSWVVSAILHAKELRGGDQSFGRSLAFQGDRMAVRSEAAGVPEIDPRVEVFERLGGTWTSVQTIDSPAPELEFGSDLALCGDALLVGASRLGPDGVIANGGSAFLYRHTNDGWRLFRRFDGDPTDGPFGEHVACDDSIVAFGLWGAAGASGRVMVYRRDGAGYVFESRLDSQRAPKAVHFGSDVSIRPEWLIAQARGSLHAGAAAGVETFRRCDGVWQRGPWWVAESVSNWMPFAVAGERLAVASSGSNGPLIHLYSLSAVRCIPN
jgi:hypothetical protein